MKIPKVEQKTGEGLGWWQHSGRVFVRCSGGHVSYLPHKVDAGGRVFPSIVCGHAGCSFHGENAVLEGWEPNAPRA